MTDSAAVAEYARGREDADRHLRGTQYNWVRSTVGPFVWVGIPLACTWLMLRGPTSGGFVKNMTARLQGKAPAAKAKSEGSNPMSEMMEMMMPIQKREFRVDVKGTKFPDVIGIPEAKEEVSQYVEFLKTPERFTRLGARLPRGCILTGEPGTGKTLLAKAMAGEAEVPFFSCNGADFVEVVGGSGPKRVRELFKEAREASPCIVFIDEVDAIGSRSGKQGGGGSISSEENRTINQLLAELDGLETGSDAVVVLAATNFQDNIDKALLREGRFDRKVNIDMPDVRARREVFQHYLNKVVTGDKAGVLETEAGEKVEADPAVSNTETAHRLADLTPGISPASVATVVNEAALQCAIAGDKKVTFKALTDAVDNTLLGKKQRNRMGDDALRRTALHEAGHALVAWRLPQQKDVLKISVQPRGNALGYTQKGGSEYHEYQTNVTLFSDLCVLMGGRAAEVVLLGNASIGAQDDIQKATEIAVTKLLAHGMSRNTGMLAFHPEEHKAGRMYMHYSETTQHAVEQEAKKLVGRAYDTAKAMVEEHQAQVQKLGDVLVEKKELLTPEIKELWGERPQEPTTASLAEMLHEMHKAQV